MNVLKKFIVIEGVDGAGTTTQCNLLCRRIENSVFQCEPTDGFVGRAIREILSGKSGVDKHTLAMLFASDRSDHLFKKNGLQDLCKEKIVINDRYILSSFAYQTLDVQEEIVEGINSYFPVPEITFFVDTDVDECCSRISKRSNREIYEVKELQVKIRENYIRGIERYKRKGWNIEVIDGNRGITEINEEIFEKIKNIYFPVDKRVKMI